MKRKDKGERERKKRQREIKSWCYNSRPNLSGDKFRRKKEQKRARQR